MSCYFENQLKGFNPIVAALQALGKDEACAKCIGLEGAINKVAKLLDKKIRKEAEGSSLPDERKSMIITRIDELVDMLEGIGLASECSCQKTDGNCTIGSECLAKGIPALIELVKEPATP
ncbi:hypothetical protein KJ693_03580 [bacterium]|nr:hypothetical protein [bacterium]MBU1614374.1 hypothetical protein [bacterium]